MNKDEILPVGRITGVHGIKGEIKVALYGDLEGIRWTTVFLTGKEKNEERRVERVRPHKGALILVLEGLTTRTEAEGLVGLEISLRKGDLPELEEDEYYYSDLVGMEVWADDGRRLGTVTNIIATGSNDVLEVHGDLGEVLIPAIEDALLRVDLETNRITVHLLEGLVPDEK